MQLVVRPATGVDLEMLVGLAERARSAVVTERGGAAMLQDLGLIGDGSDRLARVLEDPASMLWCAEIDGLVVGYLVASLRGEDDARVVSVRELWVEPEAREVGAGEELVSAAVAWAIAEDATAIDAHALPGARATKNLFERLGLTARLLTVRRNLR